VALIHTLVLALVLPLSAEAPRVSVRAEDGLADQTARAAAIAGPALARIEADLAGLRVPQVEVRLVKHAEDIAAAAPAGRGAPTWASGTAYPDEGVVVVALRGRDGALLDWERTLAHELAHVALGRALGGREPRWLTEGFANLHSSDESLTRATTLFGAMVAGKIRPLWEIEETFPAEEAEAGLAYAESYDFVAWLAWRGRWSDDRDDGDREPFRRFLAELAAGNDLDAAGLAAYGRRLVDLEAEWLGSLRARYLWVPLSFFGGLVWVLASLLLVIGWLRRRAAKRSTLRRWEIEEAEEDARDE
jgi:hypothetical protein